MIGEQPRGDLLPARTEWYVQVLRDLASRLEQPGYRLACPPSLALDPGIRQRLGSATAVMVESCAELEHQHRGDPRLEGAREAFRRAIAPWFRQSLVTRIAIDKPRGPGSCEIMETIYRGSVLTPETPLPGIPAAPPPGTRLPDPAHSTGLGVYIDRLFLDQQLARSIRNRMEDMRRRLEALLRGRPAGAPVSILNVASGSAHEWQRLLAGHRDAIDWRGVRLVCMDHDRVALAYLREQLDPLPPGLELHLVRDNVLRLCLDPRRMLAQRHGLADPAFDLVYSIGLYDYLDDRRLHDLLTAQRRLLRPGGHGVVAFKDCGRFDRVLYDWLGDWRFVARTPAAMETLLERAGYRIDPDGTVREPTGAVLLYRVSVAAEPPLAAPRREVWAAAGG